MNPWVKLGLFWALIAGPRKTSHAGAANCVLEALRCFRRAGIEPPPEVTRRGPGLQWAQRLERWARTLAEDWDWTPGTLAEAADLEAVLSEERGVAQE